MLDFEIYSSSSKKFLGLVIVIITILMYNSEKTSHFIRKEIFKMSRIVLFLVKIVQVFQGKII